LFFFIQFNNNKKYATIGNNNDYIYNKGLKFKNTCTAAEKLKNLKRI